MLPLDVVIDSSRYTIDSIHNDNNNINTYRLEANRLIDSDDVNDDDNDAYNNNNDDDDNDDDNDDE